MKIAIDFDGTIADHMFPHIGEPVPGAFEWLRVFRDNGAELILWTMRSDGKKRGPTLTDAVQFCKKHGVNFAGINHSPGQQSWTTSPKAYAEIYIDDAAFGCPLKDNPRISGRPYVDWSIVGPAVLKKLTGNYN